MQAILDLHVRPMAIKFNRQLSASSLWAYFHRKFENIGFFFFTIRKRFDHGSSNKIRFLYIKLICKKFRAVQNCDLRSVDLSFRKKIVTIHPRTFRQYFLLPKKKSTHIACSIKCYGRIVVKIYCLWAQNTSRNVQQIQHKEGPVGSARHHHRDSSS